MHNLSTIPGISPFSAVWILAETGNIGQYPRHRYYTAYSGCCPRIVSSANKTYSAHITRHSNPYLRSIFFNAAVVICNLLKAESYLKEYSTHIIQRKTYRSYKLAYCIVAAKVSRIVYALLRDGVSFDPKYMTRPPRSNNDLLDFPFSIADRKLIRRARNILTRVKEMDEIGFLGPRAEILAEQLNELLQGKKVYMI